MAHNNFEERRAELLAALDPSRRNEFQRLVALLRPADLAAIAASVDEATRLRFIAALDEETAARVVEELDVEGQQELLSRLPEARAKAVLAEMSPDDLADLVGELPEAHRQRVLELLPPDDAQHVRHLLVYPERSAGGIMTPEFVSLRRTMTAQGAIEFLRTVAPEAETVYYLYVTDEARRLVGVVSLRQLITANSEQRIEDIMSRRVISVPAAMDQEEVARLFRKYDFLALPVVNDDNVLLGVVTVDDVMDVLSEEASEDIQLLGGAEPIEEPYFSASIGSLVRKRIGWLFVLFFAQSFTGTIMAAYEAELSAVIALAFFIPLLIDTAGNAGSQAASLVLRSMTLGQVRFADVTRVIGREFVVGAILGVGMAVLAFLRARAMGEPAQLGYTVASAIFVVIIVAATVGGALPLITKRLRLDPAVASGPVITTIADGLGLIIYFQLARLIMGI